MSVKQIGPETKLAPLLKEYPFLEQVLADLSPRYELLKNKVLRATAAKMASLSMVAGLGEVPLAKLLETIRKAVAEQTGENLQVLGGSEATATAESLDSPDEKMQAATEKMAALLKKLHQGADPESLKDEFKAIEQDVGPDQIVAVEEMLIQKGTPAGEIQRLCDVHVSMFKTAIDGKPLVRKPAGHPINTYMAENLRFMNLASDLTRTANALAEASNESEKEKLLSDLRSLTETLSKLDLHYQRKENQLFPYLEKHGVSGPPQVMWGIHDEIRAQLKELAGLLQSDKLDQAITLAIKTGRNIVEMAYKEDRILFPMAEDTLTEEEWVAIRQGEDEIGYCFEGPGADWPPRKKEAPQPPDAVRSSSAAGDIRLDEGSLPADLINLMLKHMPVDITFVDDQDRVRYYSAGKHRIFPRSPGIIGRAVQQCHPPKSVHIVERIVQAFKDGERDVAEFWFTLQGRFIHIRYFAVRDDQGRYKGVLEVSQDVTDIRALEGEQRLLSWDRANPSDHEK